LASTREFGAQTRPLGHAATSSGSHGRVHSETPLLKRSRQLSAGSGHVPSQNASQLPVPSEGSRSFGRHHAPSSQSSMPETNEPSTLHGSPGAAGLGSSGEQRVAFQKWPPSFAHGMHFSPSGQS